MHKRTIIVWIILYAWKDFLQIEKDYLWLEKTIYGLNKDYLRLWGVISADSEFIFDHVMHF